MNPKPIGQRIRSFFEQLITSRHVRFLEAEIVRIRLEKDVVIKAYQDEKRALQAKVDRLEQAMWPKAFADRKPVQPLEPIETAPVSFAEAVEQHNRKLAELDAAEQKAKAN